MSIEEYAKAKKELDEFKRVRMLLGIAPRKFFDPERAKKDLSSAEFLGMDEEATKKGKRS